MKPIVSLKQILTSMGALLAGSVVARGFTAIALVLTARWLGPDLFGQFAASLALARIVAVFFSLGLESWLLQSGGRDRTILGSKAASALTIQFGLGLVWITLLAFLAPYLNQDAFPTDLFLLCAVSIFFEILALTATNGFKAVLQNNITLVLLISGQALYLLFTLVLIANDIRDAQPYLTVRIAAAVLSALFSVAILAYYHHLSPRKSIMRQAIRETPAFGLSNGLAAISQQADVTIVANWLGKSAAGLYAPAISVASTLFLIPATVYGVMVPSLSQTHAQSPQAAKSLAGRLMTATLGLGIVLGVGLLFLAKPLVTMLYGQDYTQSGEILAIFSGVLFFRTLTIAAGAILAAVGWQSRRVLVQAIAVIFNVGMNILIVQRWGLTGVALIYILTEALLFTGYFIYVRLWMRSVPKNPTPAILDT